MLCTTLIIAELICLVFGETSTKNKSEQTSINYSFLITIIIPVFNTGRFLETSLNSLFTQTIGWDNLQVIIVNDGSTDISESVALKFQELFPKNIIYIYQEKHGASSARNAGLKHVRGKYLTFLDSDDYWEKNALLFLFNFFENHYNETDIITGRMKFFEAKTDYHVLDYKFTSTRIVNLLVDYSCIQLSAATCLFKSHLFQIHRFSEKLQHQEDAQLVNTILLDKCTIGIVREALYFCRRRSDGSSAVQTSIHSRNYFLDSPVFFAQNLFNQSLNKYGKILSFIQYLVMYDLQWKIPQKVSSILSPSEQELYSQQLTSLLKKIDSKIVLLQKFLPMKYKMLCISEQQHRDARDSIVYKNAMLVYHNFTVMQLRKFEASLLRWYFLSIRNNTLYIEGRDLSWLSQKKYTYIGTISNVLINTTFVDYPTYNDETVFGLFQPGRIVKMKIPLQQFTSFPIRLDFYLCYDKVFYRLFPPFESFSHLPEAGYLVRDQYLIKQDKGSIYIYQ